MKQSDGDAEAEHQCFSGLKMQNMNQMRKLVFFVEKGIASSSQILLKLELCANNVQKITSQIMIPRSGLNVQFCQTIAKLRRFSKAITILYLGQQVADIFWVVIKLGHLFS